MTAASAANVLGSGDLYVLTAQVSDLFGVRVQNTNLHGETSPKGSSAQRFIAGLPGHAASVCWLL